MRLLLDMGIARRSAQLLRSLGHDASHLAERALQRMPDPEVLALAAAEARVVVTLDADFSALLALSAACRPSVIHIRQEGLDYQAATELIARVVATVGDELARGCIASVSPTGIRIRQLPITPPC